MESANHNLTFKRFLINNRSKKFTFDSADMYDDLPNPESITPALKNKRLANVIKIQEQMKWMN